MIETSYQESPDDPDLFSSQTLDNSDYADPHSDRFVTRCPRHGELSASHRLIFSDCLAMLFVTSSFLLLGAMAYNLQPTSFLLLVAYLFLVECQELSLWFWVSGLVDSAQLLDEVHVNTLK